MTRTEFCLFRAQEDLETMQAYAQVSRDGFPPAEISLEMFGHLVYSFTQVFNKLIRRYKYLEKGFEEEIKKVSWSWQR